MAETKLLHENHISESEKEPSKILEGKARKWDVYITDKEFAQKMDDSDELSYMRGLFHYPKKGNLPPVRRELVDVEADCIYLNGNSLGLMPKSTTKLIQGELDKWATIGAFGHFSGEFPWVYCDAKLAQLSANMVGAKAEEVVLMNALTVNQHLGMISFYKPTSKRHKVLLEEKAFPSDHFCIESQIKLRGFDPLESMLCLQPREGEATLRADDIISVIESEGEQIALVMLPGVQYYTGQLLDMQSITTAAHKKGCMVGFDLAHAVGNVQLELHNWDVDFAVWCNYKYMNSGAGTVGGLFVHEKHNTAQHDRLVGWWSHKEETRFGMHNKIDLSDGAASYRISNPSMFHSVALYASLEVFSKTTMAKLCAKSRLLTGYLEALMKHYFPESQVEGSTLPYISILTPSDPKQRGCQLSISFSIPIIDVFDWLEKYGVVCDKRKPSVLRLAPVPLYNSFMDIHQFMDILRICVDKVCQQ